jgi:hypothetical protein
MRFIPIPKQHHTVIFTDGTTFDVNAACVSDAIAIALEHTSYRTTDMVQVWLPDPDDPYNPDPTTRSCLQGTALDIWFW